jgi:hypothetical protein
MSKLAKVLQAAAGNAGGAGELAAAIDFDGTNDYLSRASDLTGNADGKTFTFSAWIYETSGNSKIYHIDNGSGSTRFQIAFDGTGASSKLEITGTNASGTTVLNINSLDGNLALNTWQHILVSIDLTNSSNRRIYINDVNQSVTWNTYSNDNIDFTSASYLCVGAALYSGGSYSAVTGRLSNVFLDYTYRNLEIEANRRLFITEDLKPADGQADLNPILYLPLDDPEDIGYNAGTGGNFTVNGVMARSGRGPNQYNCVASKFDGVNDWIGGNGQSAFSSSRMTISFIVKWGTLSTWILSNNGEFTGTEMNLHIDGTIIKIRNSAGTIVFQYTLNLTAGAEHLISLSFDLTNASSKCLFIDGVDKTSGVTYNATGSISYASNWLVIGRNNYTASQYFDGSIGELFIDNSYKDLVSNNIFYDDTLNKPKALRQVLADEGINPLHAYPISANNTALNIGSNGSITSLIGVLVGARGASEFLARSAKFNGTTGYLSRGASLTGSSDGKQATLVFSFNGSANKYIFDLEDATGTTATTRFGVWVHYANNKIFVDAYNASNTRILDFDFGTTLNVNQTYIVMISVDMTSASKRHTYIDSVSENATYTTYTNDNLKLTQTNLGIGARLDASVPEGFWSGDIGFLYFNNSYIDFSQEANRLKFVDALGYPVDLTQQIEDEDIPTPLVYMKFDDTSALGTNSGTGGDFTVNGTVTAGADVGS